MAYTVRTETTLGIIPAGGEGSRWGGYYKEFLPYGDGEWLVDRSVTAMKTGGAHTIAIISNTEKLAAHARHLKKHNNIFYLNVRSDDRSNFITGMREVFYFCRDINYFGMPDTYYPTDIFAILRHKLHILNKDLMFGTFVTKTPKRFGILDNGKVINKPTDREEGVPHIAWGTIAWTRKVSNFWMETKPDDFFTDALQEAMDHFSYGTHLMEYYYDMASWNDYQKFLKDINNG